MLLKDLHPLFEEHTRVSIIEDDDWIGDWKGTFPVQKSDNPGAIVCYFNRKVIGIGTSEDGELLVRLERE